MRAKSITTLFLLLVSSIYATAQSSYIASNKIVSAAQETSLYSDDVDWEILEEKFLEISKGLEDTESLLPALQYLINTIGDKHATIRSTKNYQILVSYTGPNDTKDARKSSYVNTVINDIEAKFSCKEAKSADKIYGHLNIVGIGGNASVEDEAANIQNCIADLKSKGTNKWIIDLRNNGGGNMNPMIAGMSPFLEDGFIGGALDANDSLVRRYEIINGNFYDTERLVYEAKERILNCTTDPIVVLTSKYTASSGEVLAVAFKGRPNTVFIGEQTSGYTSGNGYQVITDELALIISQNYIADRTLKKYTQRVDVDIDIPFIEHSNPSEDKQLLRAMDWLLKQK